MNILNDSIKLHHTWLEHLKDEFQKPYMKELNKFLLVQKKLGKTIYPKGSEVFDALNLTPFDRTGVVIIGQDPYHSPNQAHGISFSVNRGINLPPSLKNIFQELKEDLKIDTPKYGDLSPWAKQGILLLNTVLTVEAGKAASHHGKGWEQFTDKIIELLNSQKKNLVFILWGSPAQKKGRIVDSKKHKILQSAHPSPLSAYRGFFGSRPFSKTNAYLKEHNLPEIDWRL